MNPILNGVPKGLGQNFGQNFGQMKQMFQMLKSASNPQRMIAEIIANSPNGKEIMDYINQFNGDYEKAFRSKAQEMGIDVNDFLNNMK